MTASRATPVQDGNRCDIGGVATADLPVAGSPVEFSTRLLRTVPEEAINAFAGAAAGLVSSMMTCPLDVVKTRLQAQGMFGAAFVRAPSNGDGAAGAALAGSRSSYHGLLASLRKIWSEEGLRGLYRGLSPMMIGYLPTWATYFGVYEKCKDWYQTETRSELVTHIMSAMTAGVCATVVTNPIWVVKTRFMSQRHGSPPFYRSTLDAFRTMYAEEGIRVFYSGLIPSLIGTIHVAVQFPLYERFKVLFTQPAFTTRRDQEARLSTFGIICASTLAKIAASACTYPHEVIRTRLQNQKGGPNAEGSRYRGVLQAVAVVYREEGWRMFYSGMGTNMIRTVPGSAMTLLTYELLSTKLKDLKYEPG